MSARPIVVAAAAAVALLAAACGGAAPGAAPPESPAREERPAPEPTTIEQAEDDIARARAELAGAPSGAAAADSREVPSATSTPAKPESKRTEEAGKSAEACQSPCRAIASMRRAVTALCRMTGAEDTRCTDAKRTLSDSESKIAPCGC